MNRDSTPSPKSASWRSLLILPVDCNHQYVSDPICPWQEPNFSPPDRNLPSPPSTGIRISSCMDLRLPGGHLGMDERASPTAQPGKD